MRNSFERTYKKEFGSLGTWVPENEEDIMEWDDDYSQDLDEVLSQFLGFLHYLGIYRYELRLDAKSEDAKSAISAIRHKYSEYSLGLDLLESTGILSSALYDALDHDFSAIFLRWSFVCVWDDKGNLFWYRPFGCEWKLRTNVKPLNLCIGEVYLHYAGEANKSAYEFLRDNYNGDSLLEELLLLFEHLSWVRSGCLKRSIRTEKDEGVVQILEGYSFPKRKSVNVDERRLKNILYKAQRERCTGCGIRLPEQYFDLDHIWPESKGGELFFGNAQLLCKSCNRSKQDTSWVHFLCYRGKDLRSAAKRFEQSETEPLF